MSTRILVAATRSVPAGRSEAYEAAWQRLHRAVRALDANAWRFVSAADPRTHLEFLEFRSDADPRAESSVAGALEELEREIGASERSEWVEK